MSPPIRIAIAGCGRIAELAYLPAAAQIADVRLCALADPSRDRRERLAVSAGVLRSFADVAEMLAAERPDALVVASPPACHAEHAELAARHGVPVLVEKPPGLDAADAGRIAALGDQVWVGFNRRFSHLRRIAGDVPRSGELRLALRISYRRVSWRPHEVRDDALADLGPHLADLAACLLGEPPLQARTAELSPDRAEVELVADRGRAELVCEANSTWAERVEVRDGRGRLRASSAHGGLPRNVLARFRRAPHPLTGSIAAQLRALAGAVRGGDRGMLASAADGLVAMRALDAARRSAASGGRPVAV